VAAIPSPLFISQEKMIMLRLLAKKKETIDAAVEKLMKA
jgi:hypothetical protein